MTWEKERKEEGGEQRCLRWKEREKEREDGIDGGIDGWMLCVPSFSPIAAIDKSVVGHSRQLLGA